MKHRFPLLCALALLAVSLTACGGPAPAESVSISSSAAETGPENSPIPTDGQNHRQEWQEYGRVSLTACGGPAPAESVSISSSAAETGPENSPIPTDGQNHRQEWQEYGRLERLRLEIPADAPVAVRAASFTISRQEIEALASEYALFNDSQGDAAYQKAQDALIRKYAIYAHALAQGFESKPWPVNTPCSTTARATQPIKRPRMP